MNRKIGIIVADVDEFAPLADRIMRGEYTETAYLKRRVLEFELCEGVTVLVVLCGIGKVNATAAAAHFADIGCDMILNYGLSGGISGVSRGDICLCTSFLEHDFDLTGIGYKPCEKPAQESFIYSADKKLCDIAEKILPSVKKGTAVTGDCFVSNEKLRTFLKEEFNAMSCDMETAAIAYVCEYSDLPFVAVRRISDDAGSDAAESYREMNTAYETSLSDFVLDIARAAI